MFAFVRNGYEKFEFGEMSCIIPRKQIIAKQQKEIGRHELLTYPFVVGVYDLIDANVHISLTC